MWVCNKETMQVTTLIFESMVVLCLATYFSDRDFIYFLPRDSSGCPAKYKQNGTSQYFL